MHCSCDDRFRSCLKLVDSQASSIVGNFFFNVGNTKCFVFKMEEVFKIVFFSTFPFSNPKRFTFSNLGVWEAKLVGRLPEEGSAGQGRLEAACRLLDNTLSLSPIRKHFQPWPIRQHFQPVAFYTTLSACRLFDNTFSPWPIRQHFWERIWENI